MQHTQLKALPDTAKWHIWSLLAILVTTAVCAAYFPEADRVTAWLTMLGLMMGFTVILGHSVTGLWRGALIDGSRDKISLSRLQVLLWTLLVLSTLLAAALTNLSHGSETPLSIDIPSSLWVLLGISAGSMVSAPLVRQPSGVDTSKNGSTSPPEAQSTDQVPAAPVADAPTPSSARWRDVFTGERARDQHAVDVAKLQMFLFTFILLVAYGAAIAAKFASSAGSFTAFPPVDDGINVLLGISHTGYLASKSQQTSPRGGQ